MTHHQIPNEICIWKSQMIEFLDRRRKEVAIGVNQDNYNGALYYVNKDAFIKKACSWLEENLWNYWSQKNASPDSFIEDFKNYLKEE